MNKILRFLDNNLLTILTGLLIVVVPLYPKLPLADLLPGYIVRMRLEDILIAFSITFYGVQLLRRKLTLPHSPVAYLMLGYLAIGLLSSLSAIIITRTVPFEKEHLLKLALHLFRRAEYFSLFFLAYAGIKNKRDLKIFLVTTLLTLLAVVIYGFGQKYLYWPAFSTMNREFSKGMRLYLTATSRVMSTFGGHYDYAAYLMLTLTGLVSGLWLTRQWWLRLCLGFLALIAYWSLLLTASRTSFIGYLAGISLVALVIFFRRGFRRIFFPYFFTLTTSLVLMFTVGDLSERFLQIIQSPSTIHGWFPWIETGKIEEQIFKVKDFTYRLQALKRSLTSPAAPEPPKNSISTDQLSQVAVSSDIPPSPNKPLPPDVTEEEDELRNALVPTPAATSAATSDGGGYSPNALRYGLSVAIRLDALWPRAIAGFKKNPLLGTGYSTLVKTENTEFTQAESTDNDYLRMLGETGLLGTLSFLAILGYLCYFSVKKYCESKHLLPQILSLTTLGAIVALLVNATYIDVFESSKVAYSLWILAALAVRTLELDSNKSSQTL